LLYTLAQQGFKVDILAFGMNVIMDTINLADELASKGAEDDENVVDLSEPCDMEG